VSSESSRAQSVELSLNGQTTTLVSSESSRAQSVELSLSLGTTGAVSSESSRAQSVELSLSGQTTTLVSSETSRAQSVELSLNTRTSNLQNGTNAFTTLNVASTETGFTASIVLTGSSGEVQATSFTTTSDMRLKTDVADLSNALETVGQIRPVFYNWLSGAPTLNPGHKELGFLAQELEEVLPNVVVTGTDDSILEGGKKAVAYDRLVALLVGAVKELKAEVDVIKADVAALKA